VEGSKKGVTMVEGTDDMASVEGGRGQHGGNTIRERKRLKKKRELTSGVHALVMGVGNNL
jgi:hypothetical protein